MRAWLLLLSFFVGLLSVAAPAPAYAGPPPMDPKRMSGIPRPDPQVPAGTLTVRVLGVGGFSDPALDKTVTLKITGADGKEQSFEAKTEAQGRATFEGLGDFSGGQAIASVELGGQTVESMPIDILPSTGSRVMLVQGASPRAAQPRHGELGGPEVPAPGIPFPMDRLPKGSLTVGTFDLQARQPVPNIDVELTITPPQGEATTRTGKTDAQGKVVFENLLPPSVPEGSKLAVRGGGQQTPEPFALEGETGYAVVLPVQGPRMGGPLPGPQIVPALPEGTVRVRVVDAISQPIADQTVQVVKRTAAGESANWTARTDARGVAQVNGVDVQQDALYFVEVRYDEAPYQSSFFGMDRRGGIDVALRVYETTSDRSVIRSALRMDVQELENDSAQVVHVYETMVQGEKAFWDPDLKLEAVEGAKGFTVLRPAEDWLDHEEKAPFATLHGPIPPGTVANLSFGYIVEHDGRVQVQWEPPFDVVQFDVLVDEDFELEAEGAEKSEEESPIPDRESYLMPAVGRGGKVEFTLSGLRIQDPLFVRVAVIGAFLIVTTMVLVIAFTPFSTTVDRLRRRRDELLDLLERQARQGAPERERERVLSMLDRIYEQLRALGADPHTNNLEPDPTRTPELRTRSVAWLVVALVGLFVGLGAITGPLSWIFGTKLRNDYRRNAMKPSGHATAAWVIGLVQTLMLLVFLLVLGLGVDLGLADSPPSPPTAGESP